MSILDSDISNDKAGLLITGGKKYHQMIRNLLETNVFERYFSMFGIDIEDSLFEDDSASDISFDVLIRVEDALRIYIPEVTLSLTDSIIRVDRDAHIFDCQLHITYGGQSEIINTQITR